MYILIYVFYTHDFRIALPVKANLRIDLFKRHTYMQVRIFDSIDHDPQIEIII